MRTLFQIGTCGAIVFLLAGCVSSPRYTFSQPPTDESDVKQSGIEEGMASYYADEFNGRHTSNGEIYDMHKLTAAHRTLPFNTKVRVTNTQSGKAVVVRRDSEQAHVVLGTESRRASARYKPKK